MGSIARACVATAVCMLLGSTAASATPIRCNLEASKCNALKYKCVAALKGCLLDCHKRALQRGNVVDDVCQARCRLKFSDPASGRGCLDKIEASNVGCSTLGNRIALRAKVEDHVLRLVARLVPGGSGQRNRCAADKIKCFSKFNGCLLARLAKGLGLGSCVDYTGCDAGLTGPKSCFEKAENRHRPGSAHACSVYDDQAALKLFDDAFVNDVIEAVAGTQGNLQTRRCSNDTSLPCTTDAPCLGGGGTCQFFFGAPTPVSAAGVSTCVTNQWVGPIAGTLSVTSGALSGSATLLRRTYMSPLITPPCPTCESATDVLNDGVANALCVGGARHGLPCDGNSRSREPSFGVTSLDCPPSPGTLVSASVLDLSHTNDGAATATVTATSPPCTGQPGKTCLCASCSGNAEIACTSDATCALAGAGTCTNGAGAPRRVNACLDDTATGVDESICAPTLGDSGECSFAPLDQTCAIDTFRGCLDDLDCPSASDVCMTRRRPCYYGYDGNVGDTVTAFGTHQPPLDHAGRATVAAVFCVAPTGSSALNFSQGLPGPGRLVLPGIMTDDGTATACPTRATFQPAGGDGGWDFGWTGSAFGGGVAGQNMITVAVSGCANPAPPCGVCNYAGPIEN